MNAKRAWAIAGVSAALILVPAGATYAVTTVSDGALTATERMQVREQARVDRQFDYGTTVGGMYGNGTGAGSGDQVQTQAGDQTQARDQLRDPAQDASGDYTGDQAQVQTRDQLRDTENCDGDGPIGDGPQAGENAGGGMMGARGSGR